MADVPTIRYIRNGDVHTWTAPAAWCWGGGGFGRLVDDDTDDEPLPLRVQS